VKHLLNLLAVFLFSFPLPAIVLTAAGLLFPTISKAHPGTGIVCDRTGNIFYTDLKNVYKIAPNGEKTIALAHVHTHELALDSADNLYGEHLWYTGEADNRWRRYVWRLSPSPAEPNGKEGDGSLTRILGEHEAFKGDFGFVRDGAFNEYSVRAEGDEFIFEKKSPDGKKMLVGKRQLKDVQWLKADWDGTLYFSEHADLWQLSPDDDFKRLAQNLAEPTPPFDVFGEGHSIFGIWLDSLKNVYVAVHTGGSVKKITPAGGVSTVVKSPFGWSPVGGTFDRTGNLWVLESTFTGSMRARKIDTAAVCKGQIWGAGATGWWLVAIVSLCLLALGIRRLW